MRLTACGLLSEKKHIWRKTCKKTLALRIVIVFFGYVKAMMLEGKRVYMPDGSSFGIYRSEYAKGELPPLKRTRFKGTVEYASTQGRNKYVYRIIFDDPLKYKGAEWGKQKAELEANESFKKTLNTILDKTNFEYSENPWQLTNL